MSNGLSARDLERVSAYLDGELSPKERVAFEQRLKSEPNLARALTEFGAAQALLRRAPQRRTPRSFALSDEMLVGKRRTLFANWTSLNLVSAVATLVLFLVFAGDIWANAVSEIGAAEEAPQALMAQEPTAADNVATATPTINPAEGAGEIEPYRQPENIPESETQAFDLKLLLSQNARWLEFAFGAVAILAGVLAWWHRRNP